MAEPLISVDHLARMTGEPGVRIADVRWYLGDPRAGPAAYRAGHLPGAVYVHLENHLSAYPGPGRHPLPDRRRTASVLGSLGFGDPHTVVAYDDRGGAIAARLWWMLRDLGHHSVHVLDGGIDAWKAAGHPVVTDEPAHAPARLTIGTPATRTIDRQRLAGSLGSVALIDVRSPERFRGDEEPIDPVAGHIPTARNAPHEQNLGPDGRFLPTAALAERYRSIGADGDTVVYCGSGVTACHGILAIVAAGLAEPALYPGSWSDWSTAGMEIATGE